MKKPNIAVVGIGRMGKGIALAFAYAGIGVRLLDSEEREADAFADLKQQAFDELRSELEFLDSMEVISTAQVESISSRVQVLPYAEAGPALGEADFIFEAVVEIPAVKKSVYDWIGEFASADALVSSTTSTMSANDLGAMLNTPERFINAHWLNPAHLIPLVELSPADVTTAEVIEKMQILLEGIGKTTVLCKASPGFIVSRIQALALNEAARIVEEGVASAEDVDKAIKTGFGIRYATLGLLEFIDFGGGDILYHATSYLGENLDGKRFGVPDIIKENMANERNGLRDGEGFYNWKDTDTDEYRRRKMADFVRLLQHRQLMPGLEVIKDD